MKHHKHISDTGLGLMSSEARKSHRSDTIETRYQDWRELGFSHREAIRRSRMGETGIMPDYMHRSSDLTCLDSVPQLDYSTTWEPSHGFEGEHAAHVIETYLNGRGA